ncbi:bridging integrator 3 [Nothobranchius furzeri]|uniref:Bridging integrator 3 n=1 Tax=Nothobranchius furzeri TaxID=105023 RepID=A0A9D2XAV4_NOTFU|nr:bridging integrator 3 [Nothobranchius furzeri]
MTFMASSNGLDTREATSPLLHSFSMRHARQSDNRGSPSYQAKCEKRACEILRSCTCRAQATQRRDPRKLKHFQLFIAVARTRTNQRRFHSLTNERTGCSAHLRANMEEKYSGVFPSLNMAVKRREQALQDYKRLQSKVEKYEEKEKNGPAMVKLHQAKEELRPVKEDFEAKNQQLLDEMPKFYQSRIDYFQPSFEALIRAQVVYFTEMYKIFSELTDQIDQGGLTDEQRQRETEAKLTELRALSIVADD